MTDPRVLILGLDGATFTVLEPFMQSGLMPNLRKLTEGGVRADLRSTMPPLLARNAAAGGSPSHW